MAVIVLQMSFHFTDTYYHVIHFHHLSMSCKQIYLLDPVWSNWIWRVVKHHSSITSLIQNAQDLQSCKFNHFLSSLFQLGFGKSMPSRCIWLNCIAETVTEETLCLQFVKAGFINHCFIDQKKGCGLIYYENADQAKRAVAEMRGRIINGKRIQVRCMPGGINKLITDSYPNILAVI